MIRPALILLCGGLLLLGCGRGGSVDKEAVVREDQPAVPQPTAAKAGPQAEPAQPDLAGNGKQARTSNTRRRHTEESTADPKKARTRIVGALLDAIDNVGGESNQVKNGLKKDLRKADEQLQGILGDNSREKIMRANRKPPPLVVGRSAEEIAEDEDEETTRVGEAD